MLRGQTLIGVGCLRFHLCPKIDSEYFIVLSPAWPCVVNLTDHFDVLNLIGRCIIT